MKETEKYLCRDYAEDLRQAGLVYKEAPDSGGAKPACDWCRRRCYGRTYRIKYGGVKR